MYTIIFIASASLQLSPVFNYGERSGEYCKRIMAILDTTKDTSNERGRIRQAALDK